MVHLCVNGGFTGSVGLGVLLQFRVFFRGHFCFRGGHETGLLLGPHLLLGLHGRSGLQFLLFQRTRFGKGCSSGGLIEGSGALALPVALPSTFVDGAREGMNGIGRPQGGGQKEEEE